MLRLVRKEGVDGCLFAPQGPQAQAAYLAIPTLLKARTSRSCGETSAVLKDRKRGTENSTGKGWVCYRVASASLSVHLRAGRQPHGWVQGTGLEAWGRAAGLRSAPWRREEARAKPPRCPAPGPAPLCPRKWGSTASSHGTGDSLPGEGAGASRGRSRFSAASFVPCVPSRASESLTQSRARIASPPTTHPERAEKLQDCRGTATFPPQKSSPQCHPALCMPATKCLCLEVRCFGWGTASNGTGAVAGSACGAAFIFLLQRTVRLTTGEWRSSLKMTGGHLVF
nr:uncharacterized protein LOC132431515 [Delphinus delphis]